MKLVGSQLALFRHAAGYTQEELSEISTAEYDTICSIEQGRRALKSDLAREFDVLLDTKGALECAVENMPEMDRYPIWAEEFIDREEEAISICSWQNQVLPGLLQTETYARATFESRVPVLDEEWIEEQVVARVERQDILRRKVPPTSSFIISEAVLRDRLGGDEVWRDAVRHLRRCADLPGITVQVMPLGRHTHAALDGPFVLLETPDHDHMGYMETQRGSQLVSDPDEVSILQQKYAMLRTQALNPEETKSLLDRLLGES
ncbi:transcriptional regulator [Streptomyces sp. JJ66]|nr:transcriptional regulator [Streptomyces sp. JJ66]